MKRLVALSLLAVLAGLCALPALATPSAAATTPYKRTALQLNSELLSWGHVIEYTIETAENRRDDELRWQFLLFGQGVRSVRRGLGRLRPPPRLRKRHTAVVAALGPVIADLFRISGAARDGDPERARVATTALVRHSAALRRQRQPWVRAVRRL